MTIEIKNLNKQYNKILAVKDINFKINKGSIVGLLGPNGCGKTTTIGMMLGLIKPTSGSVFINDHFLFLNRASGFFIVLISKELPFGSSTNIVSCSLSSPLNLI